MNRIFSPQNTQIKKSADFRRKSALCASRLRGWHFLPAEHADLKKTQTFAENRRFVLPVCAHLRGFNLRLSAGKHYKRS